MTDHTATENPSKWLRLFMLIRSGNRGWRQTLLVVIPFLAILSWPILASLLLRSQFLASGGYWPNLPRFSWIVSRLVIILPSVIVVLSGLYLIFRNAQAFIFQLQKIDSDDEAEIKERIRHRFWGWNGLSFHNYLVINKANADPPLHWSKWLGGPTLLIINDGFAAYLERGNRFSRVVGAGMPIPYLGARETIKSIVDLRPQVRECQANAWTNDGIPVFMRVRVECEIDPDHAENPASGKLVYPFDERAVRKAVEFTAVRSRDGKLEEVDWLDGTIGNVTGRLSHHISSYHFDELFMQNPTHGQILSPQAMHELLEDTNKHTREISGVKVLSIQILETTIPAEIRQQRLNVWGAKKDSLIIRIQGESQAYKIRTNEEARARAQRDLIVAIAKSLGRADSAHFPDEPLLMSLSGILDQGMRDPLVQNYMTRGTLNALQKLKDLL